MDPFWLFLILFVALVVGLIGLNFYQEKKRRETLEQLASQLGMQFTAEPGQGIPARRVTSVDFEIFQRGRSRRSSNFLSKQLIDGTEITLFDYQYTSGSGKNRSTYRMTIFSAYQEDLHLPSFRLHPENALFHGIAKAFGMKDINFESHPKFSRLYLLRGQDEDQIRLRFHPGVLTFFEENPNYIVEGSGPHLIFWRSNQRVNPEGMAAFMRLGEELVQRLRR
ncbi:MAG: hypothetical protein Q6M04_04825, partial [Thermostichus sp. BF3_bins_97]